MADTIIRDMDSFLKAFKAAPADHQEVILKDLSITHPGLAALLRSQHTGSNVCTVTDSRTTQLEQEEFSHFKKAA